MRIDISDTHIGAVLEHSSQPFVYFLCMLKDAATGYISAQTVCPVLQADPYRAWT